LAKIKTHCWRQKLRTPRDVVTEMTPAERTEVARLKVSISLLMMMLMTR
jgi:hypothetical protein